MVDFETRKIQFKFPIIGLLAVFLGTCIVNFPVILGYGGATLSDRCVFVQDLTFYFLMLIWMFYLIGFLKKKYVNYKISMETRIVSIVGASFFLLMLFSNGKNGDWGSWSTPIMYREILYGSSREYATSQEDILSEIEMSDSKEVNLKRGEYKTDPFIMGIGLTSVLAH